MDFARDGFGRLTAAGAEQAGTNAVGLDFYNHISFPRRVYGYEGCSGTVPRAGRPLHGQPHPSRRATS